MRPLFALFIRSVREDSRARFPIILRTALVLVILLIFFANRNSMNWSTAPGRDLFLMIMLLNCGFIAITALSIFPTAIAEEKEDETLTLLRMTNLSALAILFGKSTSRLLVALLLLAVQIPFTLLCVTLGGISQAQVWSAYAILGATTFFLCNLGLLASTFCKTTLRAGFLTGIVGGIIYAGLPMLVMLTFFRRIGVGRGGGGSGVVMPGLGREIGDWVLQSNPVFALVQLLERRTFGTLITKQIWISLGAGFLCFLLSWLIFDRYCAKSGEEVVRPRMKNRQGKIRRFAQVSRPGTRWPVAWKDFHFLSGGRFGIYLRLALAALGFGTAYAISRWDLDEFGPISNPDRLWEQVAAACIVGAGWVLGLEVLLFAGRIFGVERRRQTLSSLVGLPWKPGRIIRQKILGCLPALAPWILTAIAGLALIPQNEIHDAAREFRGVSWRENRLEICIMMYVTLQALLLLVSITWFSLRIRRGALPSAIAVIGVWNFVFGLVCDETRDAFQYLAVLVGVWLTVPVLILMARAVYDRLQLVAAEE